MCRLVGTICFRYQYGIAYTFIAAMKKDKQEINPTPLFYYENGLMVFTEAFHLKRGYCCNSGCRHCPYSKRNEGENKQSDSIAS
jgi:hypothetical protein